MGKYPESITVKKTGVVLGVSALALTGVLSHKDKQPKTMVDQLNKPKVIETAFIKKRRPTYHFLHSLGGVAGTGFSKRQVQKARSFGRTANFHNGNHNYYVTTYGPPWNGIQGSGETATGLKLNKFGSQEGVPRYEVAVDPQVIALGSLVSVWPNGLHYRGPFLAADTGGGVQGDHVDVYDWKNGGFSTFSARHAKVEPYHGPLK